MRCLQISSFHPPSLHPLILVDVAPGYSQYRISAGGFKLTPSLQLRSASLEQRMLLLLKLPLDIRSVRNNNRMVKLRQYRVITDFVLLRQQVDLFIFYLKSIRKFSSPVSTLLSSISIIACLVGHFYYHGCQTQNFSSQKLNFR